MVIIGVVIALMIVPLYNNRVASGVSYSYDSSYGASLGADAYNATYSGSPTNSILNLGGRYPYVPIIQTSYPISNYQYQAVSPTPTYKTYTYYTTTGSTNTSGSYYGDTSGYGYTPPGCENGTDYSTTTNEPCG